MHYWLAEKEKNLDVGSKVIHDLYFPNRVVSSEAPVSENTQSTTMIESLQSPLPEATLSPQASTGPQINTSTPSTAGVRKLYSSTPEATCSPVRKRWLECESQLVSQLGESPTTKYTPLKLDASPRQVYDKFRYVKKKKGKCVTKVDFKKQSCVSKWTVEE